MTKAERDKARAKRAGATAVCDECHVTGGHTPNCSKAAPKDDDLDSAEVQDKILHPDPIAVTIAGEPTKLFPLPAYEQRRLTFSFMTQLNAAAGRLGAINEIKEFRPGQQFAALCVRYARVLSEDAKLMAEFSRFVARSERDPSVDIEDDDEGIALRAKLITKTLLPNETLTAIGKVLLANEIFKASPAPKTVEQPKKTT